MYSACEGKTCLSIVNDKQVLYIMFICLLFVKIKENIEFKKEQGDKGVSKDERKEYVVLFNYVELAFTGSKHKNTNTIIYHSSLLYCNIILLLF